MKTRNLLACVLTAVLLCAQQQPPQPGTNADTGVTKFSVDTKVVIETVSVRDKNGKPVEGLTAKDFTVTEDGAVQTIQFCDFQKLPDAPAPQFATRPEAPATAPDDAKPKVAAPTKTQISSETPGDMRYQNRRLLVIYFDMSAMPVPDQLRAFEAATKFIKTQMSAADLMAIMKYDGGAVKVLQ